MTILLIRRRFSCVGAMTISLMALGMMGGALVVVVVVIQMVADVVRRLICPCSH